MIKYINDGEINYLKKGFYNTLAAKKINMLDKGRFLNNELDLETAIDIYKAIAFLNFPESYSCYTILMLDYLLRDKFLDNVHYDKIKEIFPSANDGGSGYNEEYGDYWDDRYEYIKDLLTEHEEINAMILHVESYRDILASDEDFIDIEVFGDLRKLLRENAGCYNDDSNMSEEEWDMEYSNIFQDDAYAFVIQGLEMNEMQMTLLSNTFTNNVDSGIASEIYTTNGNTYICISGLQLLEGLSYSFVIILKLILLNKI